MRSLSFAIIAAGLKPAKVSVSIPVEDLLAERGIDISHETVRFW
jgi:hypothetical protein